MFSHFPEQDRYKACKPESEQDPYPIALQGNHEQWAGKLHIALGKNIEVVWKQPKHGAGPGTDVFS